MDSYDIKIIVVFKCTQFYEHMGREELKISHIIINESLDPDANNERNTILQFISSSKIIQYYMINYNYQ